VEESGGKRDTREPWLETAGRSSTRHERRTRRRTRGEDNITCELLGRRKKNLKKEEKRKEKGKDDVAASYWLAQLI